jgi:ribosomal protein L37E
MSLMDKIICNRCGEEVFRRDLKIENLSKYDLSSKSAYIESIIKTDCVPFEVAESWASHGMFELCKEKTRCCPQCGNLLKTWRAKLCIACGASFAPLPGSSS